MTADKATLTHPLPFFRHAATGRVFYIAAGPCPLVFMISLQDIGRHAPVAGHVIHTATHPFGRATTVASLAEDTVRRDLGEAKAFESVLLDATLSMWANFCDDVADRLNDGEPLAEALDDTWTLGDGDDVDLDDDPGTPVLR
ncbi:MAG: hypothetical protein JNL82_17415 [Myxococcales bacterium]|nr:hypothetical protein [Myxococcales bacterium]